MPREAGSGGAAVDQHRPIYRYRKAKNSKRPAKVGIGPHRQTFGDER
jgi:hypothetical protein